MTLVKGLHSLLGYGVQCAKCGCTDEVFHPSDKPSIGRDEAEQTLKQEGWQLSHMDLWYCSDCWANFNQVTLPEAESEVVRRCGQRVTDLWVRATTLSRTGRGPAVGGGIELDGIWELRQAGGQRWLREMPKGYQGTSDLPDLPF